jgi:hypothetical protein
MYDDDDDNFETVWVDGKPTRILKPGGRMRVSMQMRDSAMRDDRRGRKRRYDPQGREAGSEQWETEDSRRQLSDAELASCRPGFRYGGRRAAADRRALYDAYDAEISNMWQTGFGGDPRINGAGSHGPRQEPPAGSPCTKNGWPGVWRRGADGMYCDITAAQHDAKAKLRSRIDPDEDDDEDDDRPSVAQAASDHQRRMAPLYDSYDAELREAFRNVKP